MTLPAGARLGAYEVIALIGQGGMGEVYRVRDSRLGREVAIKTLRLPSAADTERITWFEREARATAALNHPNILAVYDVGTWTDPQSRATGTVDLPFIVTELLDGETLRSRLRRGSLPWLKAANVAASIADALAAVHGKGIVHRDISPANVWLTFSGQVKVLDFGIASLKGQTVAVDSDESTDIEPGPHVGTTAYMSPEQVAGKPVDGRTDIFALGCVLWEMLAGRKLFERETSTETLAAILHDEPGTLPGVPRQLHRIVEQCLDKDPHQRFHSAHDLMLALRAAMDADESVAAGSQRGRGVWPVAIAAVVIATAVAYRPNSPAGGEPPRLVRSSILPPEGVDFFLGSGGTMAVAPNGQHIAFTVLENGVTSIWVRPLAGEARRIGATDSGRSPFWAPDSRRLAFFSGGLKTIDLAGGTPATLCGPEANIGRMGDGTGSWSTSGDIIFNVNDESALFVVSASGGTCRPLTTLDRGRAERLHHFPHFLPDGQRFLFHVESTKAEVTGIYVGSLTSTERTQVLATNHRAIQASGHLLFARQNTLYAVPFDVDRARVTGEPVAMTDRLVIGGRQVLEALFSASSNDVLSFAEAETRDRSQLAWILRSGETRAVLPIHNASMPRLSHDGRRIAIERRDEETGNGDIWVYDVERLTGTRLTSHPARDYLPNWSPDDRTIVFVSNRTGRSSDVYRVDARGLGTEELLFSSDRNDDVTSWSEDGARVILNSRTADGSQELLSLNMLERTAAPLFSRQPGFAGMISPNGRWVAFNSDETGRTEIWVRGLPPLKEKYRVSTAGGYTPRWRADGRELFFLHTTSRRMMAAGVRDQGSSLAISTPVSLFDLTTAVTIQFDVTADGQQFLVRRMPNLEGSLPFALVQNWTQLVASGPGPGR